MSISSPGYKYRYTPLQVSFSTPTQEMDLELEDAASEGHVRFRGGTEGSFDIGGSGDFVNVDVR